MKEHYPPTVYKMFAIIILFAIAAVVMIIYIVLPFFLKLLGINNFEIDSFLSAMISVSTGVYISVIVYVFARKQENSRKQFLIKQIVDYFELLKRGYGNDISSRHRNSDGSASELRINESFFNQKNTVAMHIFDNVNELGNKINPALAEFIKSVAIHALGFPEVKKNIKGEYLVPDYSQYQVFLKGMEIALSFLNKKRTDYNSIPEEQEKILDAQKEAQENNM